MDLQRFIELDAKLDEVIRLRGERLAEEIEFAAQPEKPRSITGSIGHGAAAGLGAGIGGTAGVGLGIAGTLLALRKGKPLSKRALKSQKNKAKHAKKQERENKRRKNKKVFDRSGEAMGSDKRKDYLSQMRKQ